jgi:AraC family transcriptional regulator of adaptative response/methylated-DNA-[protein]-cysteine methyltransferase
LYEAGFSSSGRFYEQARLGMTASSYRNGAAGERVWAAAAKCSLGRVLVAATRRGVCAILLGDTDEQLFRELRTRFAQAKLCEPPRGFAALVKRIVCTVDGVRGAGAGALPLDIRGTAFQRRVWEALRAIPAGSTLSYAQLAARLGMPGAARAVASACAANPLAVAVPCHRVVSSDGSLAGYRWGIERKRRLIEREKK